jgi:23S rRNA (cytidine1920-2'-O)/16S rRNA (cytidine1409-2'-O)-methyltransferase
LIKPQFEAGRKNVRKGGIVRDSSVHREVLEDLLNWSSACDLVPSGLIRSPITGSGGNIEFLVHLKQGGVALVSTEMLINDVGLDITLDEGELH